MGKWKLLVLGLALVSTGCASTGVQMVAKVDPAVLEKSAVIVGTVLAPDDSFSDTFVIRNVDSQETFYVRPKEFIKEDIEYYELGMYAVVVPPGRYIFFSTNGAQSESAGKASMKWTNPVPLFYEEIETGDFRYAGRANCRAMSNGCKWFITNPKDQDLPRLEFANPHLPWKRLHRQ